MELLLNPNIAYLVLVVAFVMTFVAILTPGTGLIEGAALLLLAGSRVLDILFATKLCGAGGAPGRSSAFLCCRQDLG